jgi:hypothetical protein
MYHIERAVSRAIRNPENVAERMLDRAQEWISSSVRPLVAQSLPIRIESDYNTLRSRPKSGNLSGTRIMGADSVMTRDEEGQFFGTYMHIRHELMSMRADMDGWAQVIDGEWGSYLFGRAVWFRHMLWQMNYGLGATWHTNNVSICGKCATQDDDDLMQQTNLKILDCVDMFNPTKGLKFSTYTVNSLNNSVRTQSKRELQRKRNTPVSSIYGGEDARDVVSMADRRATSVNHSMTTEEQLEWLRVHGRCLSEQTKSYLTSIIECKPLPNVDAKLVLKEVRRAIAAGKLPSYEDL